MPIHVTSIKRAVVLVYQGIAKAVNEEYQVFDFPSWAALSSETHGMEQHGFIQTMRGKILVPRVITLQIFDRIPRRHVRFSRLNIFARDRNACQYCGRHFTNRGDLNIDHVSPRSQGGTSCWSNVVASCIPCNRRKGGRTPEQAGLRLIRAPFKPKWSPVFGNNYRTRIQHKEWIPFLDIADAAYWNTELEP
jgi:5-methylcytosine-specific restriction endonuclease McrA